MDFLTGYEDILLAVFVAVAVGGLALGCCFRG
jgi:hypothetical protein